ncbi:MAG: hypothetical protein ACREQE_11035 [Candidatus Binataceae bacterium]
MIDGLKKQYGFRVIDLKKFLCDENECFVMKDGRILYRGKLHLGLNGNAYLFQQNINLYPASD